MIVLEDVPFWLSNDLCGCTCVHHNHVAVKLGRVAGTVLHSHLVHVAIDEALTLAVDVIDEILSVGRVTNALEELDALFAFQLLQSAILLDELLLISRQLHALQVVEDILLSLTICINRLQTSQVHSARYVFEKSLRG